MKMRLKILFIILPLFFFISNSCVSDFHAKIDSSDQDVFIIEGDIVENSDALFYLSKSFSLDEEAPPEGYNDIYATLIVIGDNGYQSEPAQSLGNGIYKLAIGKLEEKVSYGIEVQYNGNTYQSDLTPALYTPEIDSISFAQTDEAGNVSIRVSTQSEGSTTTYYHWEYVEDWEYAAFYKGTYFCDLSTGNFYDDYSFPHYYCWRNRNGKEILVGSTESFLENKIVNNEICNYGWEDERFTVLYHIKIKQKAITKGAYEYYQNKAKLSEEMGGLFTPQPSELSGNISCTSNPSKKVIGFVNVIKNIEEQKMFIQPDQISKLPVTYKCHYMSVEEANKIMSEEMISVYDFMRQGNHPMGSVDMGITFWTLRRCVICEELGGTKNKPDFWPNDHK